MLNGLRYVTLGEIVGCVVLLIFAVFILKPTIVFGQVFDFITSQEIKTDLGPISSLAADFNKDGNLDLAVGHERSVTLSILLGDTAGFFKAIHNFSIAAFSITAGDFNNDSNIDLATAGLGPTISILLGSGDGNFTPHRGFFVPGPPPREISFRSIKSGDFNKDGNLDLLAAGFGQYSAAILFGNGSGDFFQPDFVIASITGVSSPVRLSGLSAVGIGDFNEDTNSDLAVLNRDESRIFIFFGNGSGLFSPPINFEAGANPRSLFVEDINKDGHTDMVVAGSVVGRPTLLLGDGLGNFITKISFNLGTEEWTDAIADFNQDGNLDIAAPNFFTGNIDVGAGDGNGLFIFSNAFLVDGIPRGATSGDFNSDGFPDIAVSNPASGIDKISILLNNLVLKVNIDIKPKSFPNCVNLKSQGLTSVAILGDEHFDILKVDPLSLQFAGATIAIKKNGEPQVALEDANSDGRLDLISHFETNKILLTGEEESATLTGKLFNGKVIRGADSICFARSSFLQRLAKTFSGLYVFVSAAFL